MEKVGAQYKKAYKALVKAGTRGDESDVSSLSSMDDEAEAVAGFTQGPDDAMADETARKESSDVEMDGPEAERTLPADPAPEVGDKEVETPGCDVQEDIGMGEEVTNPLQAPVPKGMSSPEAKATVFLGEVGGNVPGNVTMRNGPAGPLPMVEVEKNVGKAPPDAELPAVREPSDVDMVDAPKPMAQQPSTPLVTAADVPQEIKTPVSSGKEDAMPGAHSNKERQRSSERDLSLPSDKLLKRDPNARDVTGRDSELFSMEVADDVGDLGETKRKI